MKTINTFEQFLLEKLGTPDAILPYVDLLYNKCMEHIDRYLDREGEFANYNVVINIPYKEIKDAIDDESFKDFPVEEIEMKFLINVVKSTKWKLDYAGLSSPIRNKSDEQSYWMENGLHVKIMAGLLINRYANSVDIENFKNYVRDTILHELTHVYENVHNKKYGKDWLWNTIDAVAEAYDKNYEKSFHLQLFWGAFYFALSTEIRARVSEFRKFDKKDAVLDALSNFNAFVYKDKILKELKITENDKYYQYFGMLFVEFYKEACKIHGIEPQNKFLKLASKNLLEILQYFEPYFKKKLEYFKRKIAKKMV